MTLLLLVTVFFVTVVFIVCVVQPLSHNHLAAAAAVCWHIKVALNVA